MRPAIGFVVYASCRGILTNFSAFTGAGDGDALLPWT
jgi:hypothetical protein